MTMLQQLTIEQLLSQMLEEQRKFNEVFRLVNQPQFEPGVIPENSSIVVPLGAGLRLVYYKLFDALPITDTAARLGRVLLDLRRAIFWGFLINNNHNQVLTIRLMGYHYNAAQSVARLDINLEISANVSRVIPTSHWMPFLGLEIAYGTAPASGGSLTIDGVVQERVR